MPIDHKLQERLDKLRSAIDLQVAAQAPLREFVSTNLLRINRDGYTWAAFRQEQIALAKQLQETNPGSSQVADLWIELCDYFLNGDEVVRHDLRAYIAAWPALGNSADEFARKAAIQLKETRSVVQLARALAAVSIDNCFTDYRDTLTVLADLYVGAEEAGLNPQPTFEKVAALSTETPTRGGCESIAKMLRGFEAYAVVKERRHVGKPYSKNTGSP